MILCWTELLNLASVANLSRVVDEFHIHEYVHHSVLGLGFFFLELRRFLFEKSWLFWSQCEPTLWSGGFLVGLQGMLVLVTEAEPSGRGELKFVR